MRITKLFWGFIGIGAGALLLNCCIPSREASCPTDHECGAGTVCNLETHHCESNSDLMEPPNDPPPPDMKPCTKQSECADDSACSAELVGQPKCMDESELVYVRIPKDFTEQALCVGATGTHNSPYCTIAEALIKAQGTSVHLRLLPLPSSTTTFGSLDLSATDMGSTAAIFVHGSYDPGTIGSPAELSSVKVSGGRSLTLIDLDLEQSGSDAASCSNGGYLTILRSRIATATGLGINATNCANLTVDRAYIEGNKGGAIRLSGTASHAISNSYIVGNGNINRAEPVITFSDSPGEFDSNTVANNLTKGPRPGGISCSSNGSATKLSNTIVVQNSLSGTEKSQFENSVFCQFSKTVIGTADSLTSSGVLKFDPVFIDPMIGNFRLDPARAENTSCCINAQAPAALSRLLDFWGTKRPARSGSDIGAEEIP